MRRRWFDSEPRVNCKCSHNLFWTKPVWINALEEIKEERPRTNLDLKAAGREDRK